MLESLRIKNIALIDNCEITFGKNLNILSGETGAGKSIIIDAFSFALGARADKTLIRHGTDTASVEAVFDVSEMPALLAKMGEYGFEYEDKLIIFRTMSENKSDIRINGRAATLSMLKDFTSLAVDILGQHEHQSLLNIAEHLHLLDKYAGDDVCALCSDVAQTYAQYKSAEASLAAFGSEAERARNLDRLKYCIDEISSAELKDGEEEELLAKREKYRNSEKILTGVATAHSALDGDDTFSVDTAISAAMNALIPVVNADGELEKLWSRLDAVREETRDIVDTLSDYTSSFDFDEATANYIEKRVDTIKGLKRKYGATVSEILATLDKYSAEYDALTDADAEIERLKSKQEKLLLKLLDDSRRLSGLRVQAAKKFETEIEQELSLLGMGGTVFKVSFNTDEKDFSANGIDKVEFLISPNVGEPLRPLARIISGGEMARFMLALKTIIARLDGIGTLVFDEVDTGISGHIGQVVAEKLNQVSRGRQVIAITHLPQVAAMSDCHYLISKSAKDGKTTTDIKLLDENGVIDEIARLAAGNVGEYGTLHAKELRAAALSKK